MANVLSMERELRDAVMHPAPRVETGRAMLREQAFYELDLVMAELVMTNVNGLIRRIDAALNGVFGSVGIWICDRDEKGLYPSVTSH